MGIDPFIFKILFVIVVMIAQGVLWVAVWALWRRQAPQITPFDMSAPREDERAQARWYGQN